MTNKGLLLKTFLDYDLSTDTMLEISKLIEPFSDSEKEELALRISNIIIRNSSKSSQNLLSKVQKTISIWKLSRETL